MLILSGPSGCGKTAAIKLLAKENSFDVIEWVTPVDPAEDENSNNHCFKFNLLHDIILDSKFLIIFRTRNATRRQIRGSHDTCNTLSHSIR